MRSSINLSEISPKTFFDIASRSSLGISGTPPGILLLELFQELFPKFLWESLPGFLPSPGFLQELLPRILDSFMHFFLESSRNSLGDYFRNFFCDSIGSFYQYSFRKRLQNFFQEFIYFFQAASSGFAAYPFGIPPEVNS